MCTRCECDRFASGTVVVAVNAWQLVHVIPVATVHTGSFVDFVPPTGDAFEWQ